MEIRHTEFEASDWKQQIGAQSVNDLVLLQLTVAMLVFLLGFHTKHTQTILNPPVSIKPPSPEPYDFKKSEGTIIASDRGNVWHFPFCICLKPFTM